MSVSWRVRYGRFHCVDVCGVTLYLHRTWLCSDEEIKSAVKEALKAGYRLIDCARFYGNEAAIGEALQDCFKLGIVKREDVFITSKLWYVIVV